ncbi:unnamed protein product [Brachionus calyciflorus]|uniref:Uncharacterized protein n=1 Tax=Brachionus calyciflorus TaxID=104777 RepID=A0A814CFJ6_9BILA|nr:unnamed protein product [Brachionus calyciflorus]
MGGTNGTPAGYRRANVVDGQVVYPNEKFYQRVYEKYIPEMIARNEYPYNRMRYDRHRPSSDCNVDDRCGPECGPRCRPNCGPDCGPRCRSMCDSDCTICNSCGPDCSECDSCSDSCCDLDCNPSYRSYRRSRFNPYGPTFNQTNVYKFSHSGMFPNGLF